MNEEINRIMKKIFIQNRNKTALILIYVSAVMAVIFLIEGIILEGWNQDRPILVDIILISLFAGPFISGMLLSKPEKSQKRN